MIRLSYLSPKTEVRESIVGGSASPKTQVQAGKPACQRVEDNAFHRGYFVP